MKRRSNFKPKIFRHFRFFRSPIVVLAFLMITAITSQRQIFRLSKAPRNELRVVKVIDGDTIILSDGRIVRYIGIDTPEKGQPFYDAAKNFNRKLVQGKRVELEFDLERYDNYGRLLAYVFVKTGRQIFVNAEMVRNGFARTYTRPPNVKYANFFARLQEEARKNRRGLWAVYKPNLSPVIGNKRTKVFHRPICHSVKKINSQNRITLRNARVALEKGFRPCRECQP